MHAYINRAKLTACEVSIFLREISQLLKIRPSLLQRAIHLISRGMVCTSKGKFTLHDYPEEVGWG